MSSFQVAKRRGAERDAAKALAMRVQDAARCDQREHALTRSVVARTASPVIAPTASRLEGLLCQFKEPQHRRGEEKSVDAVKDAAMAG